ncbi:MAG: amino acid adenylation domain-containing protein [Hamadaea sp.]|nr:amino acid adenylation domain-containing protein [Hamadaea sp.]
MLTYRQLTDAAAHLAERLRRAGVDRETIVGLSSERKPELIVGMLGIAMAGGAWLPLDPGLPESRLAYMVDDVGVRHLVTWPGSIEQVAASADIATICPDLRPAGERSRPLQQAFSNELAYVIYTSGSTGRPKPVGLPRAGLDHLAEVKVRRYAVRPGDRVAQFAPASFDVSVAETAMALSAGATLVLVHDEDALLPGPDTIAFLRDRRITHLLIAPSVLAALPDAELPDLAVIGCGGEALPAALARRWGAGRRLLNGYGPTEVSVWATAGDVSAEDARPSIGVGFDGVSLSVGEVGDAELRPVPAGEAGELLIGGAGLARGYLGRPGLTAARFVPDPAGPPGARRYRSGDVVRQLPGGDFDFVGRLDHQVKIRGFRIEPDEVTAVLREHPAVRDAVTVVDQRLDGPARLVAYAVGGCDSQQLRSFLAERLPAYMVPSLLVMLPELPLTTNGKVDRAALPTPDTVATVAASRPARTDTEFRLAEAFGQLLGIAAPGVHDNFFALGGHSLLVGRLALRLRTEFGVDVPLPAIYRAPTVAALAQLLDSDTRGGIASAPIPPPLAPARRDGPIPLSLPQERVWFLEKLAPGNLAYNTQVSVRLRGPLDHTALAGALTRIVARHEVLRTRFVEVDGVPVQEPLPPMAVDVPVLDVPESEAEAVIAAQVRHRFDLSRPPLAKWVLLRHGLDDHTLVQVEHHFVHDGWTFALLMSELVELYPQLAAGREPQLPPPPLQYADFAIWQRDWMRGDVLREHLDQWTALLAGAPHVLDLPTDRPRPRTQSFAGAALRVVLDPQLTAALNGYSREHRNSLFATMFAGFAALLTRYTGQPDLLVGTGSANRHTEQLEELLGMVVNTLVLRIRTDGRPTFEELVARAAEATAAAYAHPELPIDELIRELEPPRDPSRNPLIQVMFSFHDSAVPDLDFGGLTGTLTERHNGSAKADLNVVVIPRAAQRVGRAASTADAQTILVWEYATDLFDEPTMRRMIDHYLHLLAAAMAVPGTPVDQLPLEPPASSPPPAADDPPGLLDLIAGHVRATPHAPAIVDASGTVTYEQLWQRAGDLAVRLIADGAGLDRRVAVYSRRGSSLVLGQLAALRAGAGYVPIDPDYPAARVALLLGDACPMAVLTTEDLAGELPAGAYPVLLLDGVDAARPASPVPPVPLDRTHPQALAYVIYTSGSTGRPKGVEVSRANLDQLLSWRRDLAGPRPGERCTQVASPGFDASVMEIWGTLAAGASLHVVPETLRMDPAALVAWLTRHRIDVCFLPTPLAEAALTEHWPAGSRLRLLDTGGQQLTRVPPAGAPFVLVNHYGPTETTVIATQDTLSAGDTPTIGVPNAGVRARVLAGYEQQPAGLPGELCLGGPGVTRGYSGDPARTAAAFVPDPSGPPGSRMYRTGDQARVRPDGRLEFLGRTDQQVKLRGFRIELGETAAVLREHPGVGDAVVVAQGSGDARRLVAYIVGDAQPAELRRFAAERLPGFQVPAVVVRLPALPTGPHGKVDLAALPSAEQTPSAGRPLLTALQRELAEHWLALLERHDLDLDLDTGFFDVGGHSLLAARLVSRIAQSHGIRVPLADFFTDPTIGWLAETLAAGVAERPEPQGATAAPAPDADLDLLTDAEVEALLAAMDEAENR